MRGPTHIITNGDTPKRFTILGETDVEISAVVENVRGPMSSISSGSRAWMY